MEQFNPFYKMTEQEIIKGCIKNDRRSQNALYKLYYPLMSSVALRYSNNQEEAVQKMNGGFFKVLTNINKYDNQYAIATWIRNILVNHMIDEFRKEKKYIANIHLSDFDEIVAVDFNDGERNLEEQELRSLLKALPDVTQKVFNMYAIDGYKHREIADYLGISEGTSKWHVSNARIKLKVLIEQLYNNEKKTVELAR